MPTRAERLQQATLKFDRAAEHYRELDRLLGEFWAPTPFKIGLKRDKDRRPVYYVDSVTPIPAQLALVAGDAIQNLVSALDHLAYQLVCKDTNDNPPNPFSIYFPFAETPAAYEEHKARKLKGASPNTVALFDALKPYRGGNDALWRLHRLNNIDKHRLLFTVGGQAHGVNVGRQMMATMAAQVDETMRKAFEAMTPLDLFILPADKGFPLSPGFELFIGEPDEPGNPQLQFRFIVALNEPGIVEGESVADVVKELGRAVEAAIAELRPALG